MVLIILCRKVTSPSFISWSEIIESVTHLSSIINNLHSFDKCIENDKQSFIDLFKERNDHFPIIL